MKFGSVSGFKQDNLNTVTEIKLIIFTNNRNISNVYKIKRHLNKYIIELISIKNVVVEQVSNFKVQMVFMI